MSFLVQELYSSYEFTFSMFLVPEKVHLKLKIYERRCFDFSKNGIEARLTFRSASTSSRNNSIF